jgi:hypothetical protein
MERPGVSAQPPSLGPHRAVGSHRHGALHRTAEELHFTEAECVRFQQPLNTECVKHILEMFLVNAGIKEFELGLDPGRGLARATTEPWSHSPAMIKLPWSHAPASAHSVRAPQRRRAGGFDEAILRARTEPGFVEAGYQGIQVPERGVGQIGNKSAEHLATVLCCNESRILTSPFCFERVSPVARSGFRFNDRPVPPSCLRLLWFQRRFSMRAIAWYRYPSQNSVIFEKYFLVRKKYWKITKIGWCYRWQAVVVYIMLNKEFLAHIKWVICKSHIVRCVSGGTHIKPSPMRHS